MKTIFKLTTRNMKIYLRNKSAVFFSFFSMLIIIGLYALFLGDMQVQQLKAAYGNTDGLTWLINSWIMGGIIIVNAVNTTFSALSIMVSDKERQYIKDFVVAPIKRYQLVISYILSSIFIGIMMTTISLVIAEIYIYLNGGELLSLISIFKSIICIIFSVIMISGIGFLGYSFVKNEKAISTISAIVGTLIGFLTGIYVPVGIMPEFIQNVIKVFPVTYSVTMLKGIFISEPAKVVFAKAPEGSLYEYNAMMGNIISIRDHIFTYNNMLLVIIIVSIIFFILSIIRVNTQKSYY